MIGMSPGADCCRAAPLAGADAFAAPRPPRRYRPATARGAAALRTAAPGASRATRLELDP